MQRLLDGVDSRAGIAAFVVVVSLLAAFMIAIEGTLAGERGYVGYFVLFVLVFVGVVTGGAIGWKRIQA